MKRQYDLYSKITNKVFYIKKEDGTYTEQGSLSQLTNNHNMLVPVLHELYIGGDLRDICRETIDDMLEAIGYKLDKDNRKSLKELLFRLRELKVINFDGEEDEIKKSTLIKIDVSTLKDDVVDNYFELSDMELQKVNELNFKQNKKTGLITLFTYLKARAYKLDCIESQTNNIEKESYKRAEATYQSYEWLQKYTGIGMKQISEYIKILQEIKLITVDNCGYKYKDGQKDKVDCENIYIINTLHDEDNIKHEMEIAKIQYCYDMRAKGWHISKKK